MKAASLPAVFLAAFMALGASSCGGSSGTSDTTVAAAVAVDESAADELAGPTYGDVDPQAFATAAAVPGRVLIDVRTPEEFAEGHLEGASNIDFYAPDFAARIAALDPSKEYAIYCKSGNRSGQTVTIMQQAGISKVFNLAGGIGAWTEAGLATVG